MNRPTSVLVLGILNIAFSALGLVCAPISLIAIYARPGQGDPMAELLSGRPGLRLFMGVSTVVGMVALVALLAAGIGLIQMRPWARSLSIAYGVYALVAGVVGLVVNLVVVVPAMMEQARHTAGPEAAGAVGGAIGGVCGGAIALIYPVVLLYFMFNGKVVQAFRDAAAAAADPSLPLSGPAA